MMVFRINKRLPSGRYFIEKERGWLWRFWTPVGEWDGAPDLGGSFKIFEFDTEQEALEAAQEIAEAGGLTKTVREVSFLSE